ncbi:hypothetical protein L2D14_01285 [Thalassospiraceae bacterium LMO-JJ14]|nr:hypothetical protein L2D14_01285 [Thalassospiraceae bacterium LMO-JJ14]
MSAPAGMRPRGQSLAVVIFGPSTLKYLQVLKPGYQHCLVATQGGGQWHLLDPLSNGTEITLLGELTPSELIASFNSKGLDAIAVQRMAPVLREMPIAPYTCVEAVKRTLGIRARHILTPWQLRCYLGRFRRENPAQLSSEIDHI